MVDAIGPGSAFQGSETALTLIPNFFAMGVLAVSVSLVVVIWAALFLERKNGGLIFDYFFNCTLLVGGGLAPISLGIIAAIVATRINRPLTWWQLHLPFKARKIFSKLFPCFLVGFLLLSLCDLEIAVSGNNMEFFP
jgi:hypothetical protein